MIGPRRKYWIAGVGLFVAGGIAVAMQAASAEVVMKGVSVGGLDLSGLTIQEVSNKLAPAAAALHRRPLVLAAGARSMESTVAALGIGFDLERTARLALAAGRSSAASWIAHTSGLKKSDIEWVLEIDRTAFARSLVDIASFAGSEVVAGEVRFNGATVVFTPPKSGSILAPKANDTLLKAAVSPKGRRVQLPLTVTPPRFGPDEFRAIEAQAKLILSKPAEFVFEGSSFSVPPERIAEGLFVREVVDPEAPNDSSLVLQADPQALKAAIIATAPFVVRPAADAGFSVAGDKASVVASKDGATIDTTTAVLKVMGLGGGAAPIELDSVVQSPSFTTAQAQSLGITTRISSFTTNFDPRNAPRVGNIDKMASAVDGRIIRPGESFSLNGATGPRTQANGYQEAGIIVDGELVPGIGGGVCQVATTVFNAVFVAGLDVDERVNHSLYISKYPTGRDATVNYGFQDLRFTNDTEFGVLLKATVNAKSLTVSLFSSPLGRVVEQTASERTNPRPPPVKYIDDPTLPMGKEIVVEEGIPGFDITVIRTVMSGDAIVLHKNTFVSKYRAWKRIIRRGTGPAEAPSPTPSPAA